MDKYGLADNFFSGLILALFSCFISKFFLLPYKLCFLFSFSVYCIVFTFFDFMFFQISYFKE